MVHKKIKLNDKKWIATGLLQISTNNSKNASENAKVKIKNYDYQSIGIKIKSDSVNQIDNHASNSHNSVAKKVKTDSENQIKIHVKNDHTVADKVKSDTSDIVDPVEIHTSHDNHLFINNDASIIEFIESIETEDPIYEALLQNYRTQLEHSLSNEEFISIPHPDDDDNKIMKLFDFLMPDWRFKRAKVSNHDLITKNIVFTQVTNTSILCYMIELMKTKKKILFHRIAYNITIQFIYEKVDKNQSIIELRLETENLKQLLEGIEDASLNYILLFLTYLSHLDDYRLYANENHEWLKLLDYLRQGYLSKFENLFRKLLSREQRRYGSYHQVSFKPLANSFYYIAKSRNLTSVVELIFQLFPNVDVSFDLISSFHEQRNMTIISNDSKYYSELKNVYKLVIHYRVCKRLFQLGLPENFRDCLEILVISTIHSC